MRAPPAEYNSALRSPAKCRPWERDRLSRRVDVP